LLNRSARGEFNCGSRLTPNRAPLQLRRAKQPLAIRIFKIEKSLISKLFGRRFYLCRIDGSAMAIVKTRLL
jgi:hypothetical protein